MFATPVLACPGESGSGTPPAQQQKTAQHQATATFAVAKMHCEECAGKVSTALNSTPGVLGVQVKLADKRVVVSYDADKLTPEKIAKVISDAGYPAQPTT